YKHQAPLPNKGERCMKGRKPAQRPCCWARTALWYCVAKPLNDCDSGPVIESSCMETWIVTCCPRSSSCSSAADRPCSCEHAPPVQMLVESWGHSSIFMVARRPTPSTMTVKVV